MKGDANTATDAAPVSLASVEGSVERVVPLVGLVVVYFPQPTGVACLVGRLLTLMSLRGL